MLRKIFIPLLMLVLIQLSDNWLLEYLLRHGSVDFFSCRLQLLWNRGIAFGWFAQSSDLQYSVLLALVVLTCLGVAVIIYHQRPAAYASITVWSLILAGGLSNLVHRVNLGAIPDMINCRFIVAASSTLHFNFGDMAVVLGCFLMLLILSGKRVA